MAYTDYKNYRTFEKFLVKLDGQYVSPGGAAKRLGITRSRVANWISRDNLINAHRFNGEQGEFVIIPLSELEKDKIKEKLVKND